jgi:peptidoglycan/LPS O-acetylase OafA/YrhL
MQPLQSGVTLFFVLSGFLLYLPWATGRGRSVGSYFRNRALRILPAYWLVLLVASAAAATVTKTVASGGFAGHMTPEHLVTNIALAQGFRPSTVFTGILPTWSLGVEICFYLLLPALAVFARKNTFAPPLILFAFGVAAKLALTLSGVTGVRTLSPNWDSVLGRSLLGHADLFAYGMAAAVIYARRETPWISGALVGRILGYIGIPWTVLGFYFLPLYLYESGVAMFASVMLLRALYGDRRSLLKTRFAQASGRISYSVFLWNYPLLSFLSLHHLLLTGSGPLPVIGNTAVVFPLVAALSLISYLYVEAPALKLKRSRPQPVLTVETAAP